MNPTSNAELITRSIAELNAEATRRAETQVRGLIAQISSNLKMIATLQENNVKLRAELREVTIQPVVASEILGG